MSTSKECIHNAICQASRSFKEMGYCKKYCIHFKDRNRFVEIPFKPNIINTGKKEKVALFLVLRNNTALEGHKLGKTENEINTMTLETIKEIMNTIDYDVAEKLYDTAVKEAEKALKEREQK